MTEKFILHAKKRADVGKGASRRLRREEEMVPAILYGGNQKPSMLQLQHKELLKIIQNEAFFSSLLTLLIDDTKEQVVLKDIQRHPYKRQILHMDFMRIKTGEKIYMFVPLHFKGADIAPGVKMDGGVVQYQQKEVEVRCLPEDLPEFIEVDISPLHINEGINLSELKLPKGVEIVALIQSPDNDHPVVTISVKRKVVEEKPVEVAEAAAPEQPVAAEEEPKSTKS
ncbi:MAG: 50S ribosomal protein L25/general stress protein Ctc [Gammaproteobacteria bacterium]|nr:50S ribosomal protein L25/general stress protein Ctc [Gammaproteobacteria bacterium]